MRDIKRFPIGGTHLPEHKALTTDSAIRSIRPSNAVAIPLRQHIGAPALPAVKSGDHVTAGQLIGKPAKGLSVAIHSSVAGTVRAIETRRMIEGTDTSCVVIECDVADRPADSGTADARFLTVCGPDDPVPDADTVIAAVREAGIVGMGGAAFPTHIKLQLKPDVKIDTVIINGAECEPYITTDDRLMQEQARAVFRGLDIIRRTVGAAQGFVACEINKPQALERLHEEARNWTCLDAVRLDTRYPHGAEKHLIKAVLDREVPTRQLPMAVGVVVNNVQTAIAIAMAVDRGQPLTARVLTVSGSAIRDPGNFLAPIGTPVRDLIAAAGGASSPDCHVIIGGPMTGTATQDLELPVTKSTSGIVLLQAGDYADRRNEVCIRCGRCVSVCPMYLQPNRITAFVNNDMIPEAEEFGVNDCILCGACSYVCPSRRPLLQWLREGKLKSSQIAREISRQGGPEA